MQATLESVWQSATTWGSEPTNALILAAVGAVYLVAWWAIFSRAGFQGSLSLLMLVPGLNVLAFLLFAFASWPAKRELRSLRKLETAVSKAETRHGRQAA